MPAAGSACPMLAFTPLTTVGRADSPSTYSRIAPTSEPDSMGSPSAVPVPWASSNATPSDVTAPSNQAAPMSSFCAWPFGAVRLALLPSCRTALPTTPISVMSVAVSTMAPVASPRAYPSARESNVWQRP
eukprot:2274857-Prymnesium_polylepis.3